MTDRVEGEDVGITGAGSVAGRAVAVSREGVSAGGTVLV
jgi:hypothetical protein